MLFEIAVFVAFYFIDGTTGVLLLEDGIVGGFCEDIEDGSLFGIFGIFMPPYFYSSIFGAYSTRSVS